MKVDQNKIGNIIADEELHCRITEEYKSAIKKHFMGNSQKTKNNEST